MTVKTKFTPWMYAFTRVLTRNFFKWKFHTTVHGVENVPASGGVILAANHGSFLDPPLIGFPLKQRHVCFMARDSLLNHPVTAWIFPRIGVVPLSREKGDIGAIKTAIALLKAGECVCLFPEGTRTTDGQLQPAKGGIGFLISKAGVPVVPVYISGTFDAYPKGAKKITSGPVSISYGPPIRPDELLISNENGKVDFDAIGHLVMDRIARIKAEKP